MVVELYFKLNTQDTYDKMIITLIKEIPENQRKSFLVSAILYYVKSPSYTLNLKFEEILKQLEKEREDQKVEISDNSLSLFRDIVKQEIEKALKKEFKNIKIQTNAIENKNDIEGEAHSADELFKSLEENFVF